MGSIQCTILCFRSCVLFFHNEHAKSTSLGQTKFLGGFVRFRSRDVPVVRSGFGVHTMHHFVFPKLRLVFSQRTCPIDFFRPKTRDGNSTRGCGYPRILNPMDAGAGADLRFHPRVDPHPSGKKNHNSTYLDKVNPNYPNFKMST